MTEQYATFRFMKRKNLGNYEHEEASLEAQVPTDDMLTHACDEIRRQVFVQLGAEDTFQALNRSDPPEYEEPKTAEAKPKRKRRTKAQIAADEAAAAAAKEEAAQPGAEEAPAEPVQTDLEEAVQDVKDPGPMSIQDFSAEMNKIAAAKGADAIMPVLQSFMPEGANHVGLQLVPDNKRGELMAQCLALPDKG